jgi:hypothetical protein
VNLDEPLNQISGMLSRKAPCMRHFGVLVLNHVEGGDKSALYRDWYQVLLIEIIFFTISDV